MSGTNHDDVERSEGTRAAGRVADILLMFLQSDDVLGVSTIARRLGLPKSVVHRVLQALVSRGLVQADDDSVGYRLGPAAVAIGSQAMPNNLREIAIPQLLPLRDMTRETVTLSVVVNTIRVYVDQLVSPAEVRMTIELGRPRPLHAGASGKAILAFIDPTLRERILSRKLDALTPQTIVETSALRVELAHIAKTRVAFSRGERNPEAGSLAAPLFGSGGHVIGAISICGPIHRLDNQTMERYAPPLLASAQRITDLIDSNRPGQ